MYPKVRVREEDHVDRHDFDAYKRSSLLGLKDLQFLSIRDSCSPVKMNPDLTPPPVTRIPMPCFPNAAMRKISVSEEGKNDKEINEDNKPNIRPHSILRPRAVISSPDNDAVIGNRNKTQARPKALKNNNVVQNRHEQCKIISGHAISENPKYARKSEEFANDKSDLKVKKASAEAVSSQRAYIKTRKLSSARI